MKTLKLKLHSNKYFSFVFSVLLALSLFVLIVYPFKIIYLIFFLLFLSINLFNWKFLLIGLLICSIGLGSYYLFLDKGFDGQISGDYQIKRKFFSGYTITHNDHEIFIKSNMRFDRGDFISVEGSAVRPYGFWKTYLQSKNINSIIVYSKMYKLTSSTDVRNDISNYLTTGPFHFSRYSPLMLLGLKTSENKEIYDLAIRINILHLFVISGFHISLLYLVITKSFKVFKFNQKLSGLIALGLILIYLFFLNFPLAAFRAFCILLFNYINKLWLKRRFKNINVLTFVMALVFVLRPFEILSLSFLLTFGATYIIYLVNEMNWKSKLKRYLFMSLMIYLLTLPILLKVNGFINPLGFFSSLFISPLVIVLYILSILLLPFKDVLNEVYKYFDYLIHHVEWKQSLIIIDKKYLSDIDYLYLTPLISFIIYKLWNLFMVKKII